MTKRDIKKGIQLAQVRSGLTASEFCDALGISRQTYCNWKKSGNLQLRQAVEICGIANIDIHQFIEDCEE